VAQLRFPRWQPGGGFPRWRFAWWLLFFVEDALGRLPMLLLGPVLGAVIGTAVAVSELASVRVAGVTVAAVPSVGAVLWPAVLGGIGGIVVLTLGAAAWGAVSYFFFGGDDVWEARVIEDGAMVELVCRKPDPVSPDQLGAVECVLRWPSGDFATTSEFVSRRSQPYGLIARVRPTLTEPGTYRVRWYATEHKRRLHEVARLTTVVAEP
jgi:hypothetical protein